MAGQIDIEMYKKIQELKASGLSELDAIAQVNKGLAAADTGTNPNATNSLAGVGEASNKYALQVPNDPKTWNFLTGDKDNSLMGSLFGGRDANGVANQGIVEPGFKLGMSAWNAYQSYAALKETEKNNAAKIALANEGIYMKRVDQHNKVAKQRRYQNIGVTSANSNPIAAIAANPYTKYRPFEMKY